MTKEFNRTTLFDAIRKVVFDNWCGGRGILVPPGALVSRIVEAVLSLVEECAEPETAQPQLTPEQQVRVAAYDFAARVFPRGTWDFPQFHALAHEIEGKINADHACRQGTHNAADTVTSTSTERVGEIVKTHTVTLPLTAEIDLRALDAFDARLRRSNDNLKALHEAWEEFLKGQDVRPRSVFTAEELAEYRAQVRKEAWSDCKAVMVRKLQQQIDAPHSDTFILKGYEPPRLERFQSFIKSFRFDESKP